MDFLDDPEEMKPEERLGEVTAILAAGYLRLRRSATQLAADPDPPPFTENPLDCSGAPRPSCVEGLTAGEPIPTEVQE